MSKISYMKEPIRAFIRANWSDEKLAQVYAFNRDDMMDPFDMCACILGVTTSDVLHSEFSNPRCSDPRHSDRAKGLPYSAEAEVGYICLSFGPRPDDEVSRILSAILRAEMRRRDRMSRQSPSHRHVDQLVTA